MKIQCSQNLIRLAEQFEKADSVLYIVGGCVRNYFLNLPSSDIDICGSLLAEDVKEICKSLDYKCETINKNLGTVLIKVENEEYEYTTFRKENYKKGGHHSPEDVEFVTDIRVDASRRDFSINSIYYDILNDDFVDFYGGIQDAKKSIIKCVETPQYVFSSDGLRILRLVRFASQLGFKIERSTFKVAKELAYQLKDISAERKLKDLKGIVTADYKYGKENEFIKILNDLNIYQYLFNSNYKNFKIKLNGLYKRFFNLDADSRFCGFVILVLLNKYRFKAMPECQIQYDINVINSSLKISNEEQKHIYSAYCVLQNLMFENLTKMSAVNYHNLPEGARKLANAFVDVENVSLLILSMKQNNIPLNKIQLKITASDIIDDVEQKNIGRILDGLFMMCLSEEIPNEKNILLETAKKINSHIKNK